jgi:7-carboxy-7-deazaguanine synthase
LTCSLPISETFTSIQGEGSLAGTRSHFIRLSGCNLRCVWCDTPYASWDAPRDPQRSMRTVDSLVAQARASGAHHVVVTGGEPMIFEHLDRLCAGLRDAALHVTIETAGTVSRRVACDLMSISPKLANSAPAADPRDPAGKWLRLHEARRVDLSALQSLVDLYPARQFKFVVACEDDLAEIEALVSGLRGWSPREIMLMPEGVTVASGQGKLAWIARACDARGWRPCPRLHIEMFGNVRGT